MNNINVGLGEALWDVLPEGKNIGGSPANFAYHVSQFGFDSRVVSAVGNDELGDEILEIFREKQLKHQLERVNYPTGTVQVTLDNGGVPCYDIKEGVAWDNIPFTDDLKRLALSTRAVCFGSLAQRDEVSRATINRFLDTMLTRMGELRDEASRGGRQAVLCGDFNIAHTPLDIKTAKANIKHAGFLPAERAYVDRWLGEYEFVDVIRSLAGDIQGPYTWWSQRGRAFDNNVGWRIDYQFATPELAETARGFVIDKAPSYDARWSDHAPLTVTYDG